MHPDHQILPYYSRLDDGRVVERKHPDGAAWVAGSAQANRTGRDPLLLDLASRALHLPDGGAVLATEHGSESTRSIPRPAATSP